MTFVTICRQLFNTLTSPRHLILLLFLTSVLLYLLINQQQDKSCQYLRPDLGLRGNSERSKLSPQKRDSASENWLCENDFSEIMILPPTHKKALTYFKCRHLTAPSILRYNVGTWPAPNDLNKVVSTIFEKVKRGFFVDAYAGDGITDSNTLLLEVGDQWSGVVIEPNDTQRSILVNLNRKAWLADVCLSPYVGVFQVQNNMQKERNPPNNSNSGLINQPRMSSRTTECFPLVTITSALKVKRVNFMVLNLGTHVLNVLKTLPYDDTLQVDIILVKHLFGTMSGKEILTFMESKGYFVTHSSLLHAIFALKMPNQ
ncbi:unnamed protein product [Allacma fusca]|uniref:Methyltransferase FkbM domain-containing protein n=1 Tax=Allacma fusca TaxID=39272 RepID=A0A8J2M9Q1_9HEXA|nr:unnamed protein product [Allacma fusca]